MSFIDCYTDIHLFDNTEEATSWVFNRGELILLPFNTVDDIVIQKDLLPYLGQVKEYYIIIPVEYRKIEFLNFRKMSRVAIYGKPNQILLVIFKITIKCVARTLVFSYYSLGRFNMKDQFNITKHEDFILDSLNFLK